MSNFCSQCGNKLSEGSLFCTKCGAKVVETVEAPVQEKTVQQPAPQAAPQPAVQQAAPQQSAPVQNAVPTQQVNKKTAPKKKSKLGLLIAVIAVSLAVIIAGGGVLTYFLFFRSGGSSVYNTEDCIIPLAGENIYMSGKGRFLTSNIELGKTVTIKTQDQIKNDKDEDSDESITEIYGITPYRAASDGNCIYYMADDKFDELRKLTKQGNTYKSEVWVSNETLQTVDMGPTISGKKNARFFRFPTCYKDDVYFINFADVVYINKYYNDSYKLGKISKDGKTIKYFDDVRAEAYTIDNDWIYYYDNGITVTDSSYDYDLTSAGLYKIRTDGTNKQPIITNLQITDDKYSKAGVYMSLRVCGDYLYFIDYTKEGYGRVARLNKNNGTEPEYLTEYGAQYYTIDPASKDIYYTTYKVKEGYYGQSFYSGHSLFKAEGSSSNDEEVKIFGNDSKKLMPGSYIPTYYNGYIYFFSNYFYPVGNIKPGKSPSSITGRRYNLASKELENVYYYYESEEKYDDYGFPTVTYLGKYYKWEKDKG